MTPEEFGELIRTQREARRLTIEELAMRFKLSASILRSIEGGKLDRLPHAVYARGFVRSYAQAVGVTPEDLAAGIEALFPQHMVEDVSTVPGSLNASPARSGRGGGDKLVRLAMVLVFLALPIGAGWFVVTRYGNDIMELIKRPFSAAQAEPAAQAPEPAHSDVAPASPPVAQPAPVTQSAQSVEPVAPAADTAPVEPPSLLPSQAAVPAAPAPAETAPPAAASLPASVPASIPVPIDSKHVSIQAREACWVQVTVDGEGARAFTIQPGETSVLPYTRRISLVLGNAGGVSIVHNGQPYVLTGRLNERRTLVFP